MSFGPIVARDFPHIGDDAVPDPPAQFVDHPEPAGAAFHAWIEIHNRPSVGLRSMSWRDFSGSVRGALFHGANDIAQILRLCMGSYFT
jgi:hypothetical protein